MAEDGFATFTLPMLVWVATLVAIAVIDLGGYLVAASRAQSLADAAALAAVTASLPGEAGAPAVEADRVVTAGDGRLESCECGPSTSRAYAAVSVEVGGLIIPTIGARRVRAEASAALTPPDHGTDAGHDQDWVLESWP